MALKCKFYYGKSINVMQNRLCKTVDEHLSFIFLSNTDCDSIPHLNISIAVKFRDLSALEWWRRVAVTTGEASRERGPEVLFAEHKAVYGPVQINKALHCSLICNAWKSCGSPESVQGAQMGVPSTRKQFICIRHTASQPICRQDTRTYHSSGHHHLNLFQDVMRKSDIPNLPDDDALIQEKLSHPISVDKNTIKATIKMLMHAENIEERNIAWVTLKIMKSLGIDSRSELAKNHPNEIFWEEVDKTLDNYHKEGAAEFVLCLEENFEDDIAKYGDPARTNYKLAADALPNKAPKWMRSAHELAPKVRRVDATFKSRKRKCIHYNSNEEEGEEENAGGGSNEGRSDEAGSGSVEGEGKNDGVLM
ncbi:hypothetical protein GGX14DRAFT_398494 [Mycena pura]|uniref:Uncharacterized protein n=1 Tax=Mycena pura TaxID=153505 RepID=A0AAD6V6G2_9AGAR|nr:hypothetical protein GGX14DRAFT_398494 [Mycena pura]